MTFWKQSLTLRTGPISEEGERGQLPSLRRLVILESSPTPTPRPRAFYHLIFRGMGKLWHLSLKLPTSG